MENAAEHAPHVLVVDDDRDIRELLAGYLVRQGMQVETAADGEGLWRGLDGAAIDIVVLDLNLPGADGLALCRELRARGHAVPVIMLTARGDPIDRVVGLEIGADDYMAKPFEPRELVARIRTVLRRARIATASEDRPRARPEPPRGRRLQFAGWKLDIPARELVSPDGSVVVLTSGEFGLLRVLVENAGRVLSRDQLLNHTQGRDASPFDRSIDLHVSRLRAKLRDDARVPSLLKTVRNEGYVLVADVKAVP
ncbi:MAG TPA: response regulator [Burkholderiaceae bacterium]|nr:response regulator [Burkholderiaceae bacterium]